MMSDVVYKFCLAVSSHSYKNCLSKHNGVQGAVVIHL